MQGIYRILNLVNDKWYVGSASNIGRRWKDHKRDLRNGNANPHLQNAFNKYGVENFILEILMEVKGNLKDLLAAEQAYLDEWLSIGQLYNVATRAGGGNLGEEVNEKISKALSGKNSPNYGKHFSKETRARQSKAHMGHTVSNETRAKLSKSKLGENNPRGMLGKHQSEEARVKNAAAHAEPYPSFYNTQTDENIPVGINLKKLCIECNLSYQMMWNLKADLTKKSKTGWRLATEEEVLCRL